jgi:predicted GIY-YIG superfamily endonuclease
VRFIYVYILQSEVDPDHFYTGSTGDLAERLRRPNEGRVPHTSKWKPWKLKTCIAMSDRNRAAELEKYFKIPFGSRVSEKHL